MSDEAYAVVVNGRTYVEMYEAQKLIRQARRSALEEAAMVADGCDDGSSKEGPLTAHHIATAIRAMKGT